MVYARSDEISRNPLACAVAGGGSSTAPGHRRPPWPPLTIEPAADPTRSSRSPSRWSTIAPDLLARLLCAPQSATTSRSVRAKSSPVASNASPESLATA